MAKKNVIKKKKKSEATVKANIKYLKFKKDFNPTQRQIKCLRKYIETEKKEWLKKAGIKKSMITEKGGKHNIIVTAGRTVMAQTLSGDTNYTGNGEISYGALGTGVSPSPSNSDTTLSNEVFRKAPSSRSVDGNIAYMDFFFTASDTDGTYTEFGNFIDGSSTADTGELFSYIATGGWTKSSSESLFVSCKYTIS